MVCICCFGSIPHFASMTHLPSRRVLSWKSRRELFATETSEEAYICAVGIAFSPTLTVDERIAQVIVFGRDMLVFAGK